jgi:outer membrane murein-binding lipoprotein Lpp
MSNDLLGQLLGYAGAAVAVYAGIRADLAALRAKIEHAHDDARLAHKRIDHMGGK